MPTTKKYVSLDKLSLYDEKIKKVITDGDAAALAAAKEYANGLADNYDAAGSAATAEANAKAYADGKDAAIAAAQKAGDDAAAAAGVADGKAVAAQTAADNAQAAVDALDEYVGDIPSDEAYAGIGTVIGYVNKKAEETLAAAQGGSTETAASVKAALDTYKGENDAKVNKNTEDIGELNTAIETEKARAEGIESGLDGRIKALEDDHLTAADKQTLEGSIATNAAAIERLTNGVSAEEIDSVNDLIQYTKDHGTEVTGMQEDIAANTEAIDAEAERAKGEEAKNAQAAADALSAAQTAQSNVEAEAERAAGVEGGLDSRLQTVEAKFGDGEGTVADMIADAKQEAIDTAASDATTKANTAETNAKGYADGLNTAMNGRVEALEAIDHDHSNKALLDSYTQTEANLADAVAKKHEHSNLSVLETVTSAKITAWDAAEGNAKNYADGLNATMSGRMDAVELWQTNMVEVSEAEINALFTA